MIDVRTFWMRFRDLMEAKEVIETTYILFKYYGNILCRMTMQMIIDKVLYHQTTCKKKILPWQGHAVPPGYQSLALCCSSEIMF